MMRYISTTERLLCAEAENRRLKLELNKKTADIDYIAMMCDVDLDTSLFEQIEEESD